jgi:hypothetical protein
MTMKLPSRLQAELDQIGRQVLSGETARSDAAGILADRIAGDETFVHLIAADFARKQLRQWVSTQLRDSGAGPGGQLELFPWLPRFLETSPGRFSHVLVMDGEDWDAALRQAEVKADNAQNYAKGVKRAHDQVRPLLTDDTMTTADVADQLGS